MPKCGSVFQDGESGLWTAELQCHVVSHVVSIASYGATTQIGP
jgi:hypothetical protein